MSNPNHDEHGKFASHAQDRANETGNRHHVISKPNLPGLTVLNDGQVKTLKIKKEHIVSTHKPNKKSETEYNTTNMQDRITSQYFKDVKKRGY